MAKLYELRNGEFCVLPAVDDGEPQRAQVMREVGDVANGSIMVCILEADREPGDHDGLCECPHDLEVE